MTKINKKLVKYILHQTRKVYGPGSHLVRFFPSTKPIMQEPKIKKNVNIIDKAEAKNRVANLREELNRLGDSSIPHNRIRRKQINAVIEELEAIAYPHKNHLPKKTYYCKRAKNKIYEDILPIQTLDGVDCIYINKADNTCHLTHGICVKINDAACAFYKKSK